MKDNDLLNQYKQYSLNQIRAMLINGSAKEKQDELIRVLVLRIRDYHLSQIPKEIQESSSEPKNPNPAIPVPPVVNKPTPPVSPDTKTDPANDTENKGCLTVLGNILKTIGFIFVAFVVYALFFGKR